MAQDQVKFTGIRCELDDKKALLSVLGALGIKYAPWLRQSIQAQYRHIVQHGPDDIPYHLLGDTPQMRIRLTVALAATLLDAGQSGVINRMLRALLGAQYEEWTARRRQHRPAKLGNPHRIYDTKVYSEDKEAHEAVLQAAELTNTDWLLKTIHAQADLLRELGIDVDLPDYSVPGSFASGTRSQVPGSAAANIDLAIAVAATSENGQRAIVDRMLRILLDEGYDDWVAEYNAAHVENWVAEAVPA